MNPQQVHLKHPRLELDGPFYIFMRALQLNDVLVSTNFPCYYDFEENFRDFETAKSFRKRVLRMNKEGQSCLLDVTRYDIHGNEELIGMCGIIKVNRITKEAFLVYALHDCCVGQWKAIFHTIMNVAKSRRYEMKYLNCRVLALAKTNRAVAFLKELTFFEVYYDERKQQVGEGDETLLRVDLQTVPLKLHATASIYAGQQLTASPAPYPSCIQCGKASSMQVDLSGACRQTCNHCGTYVTSDQRNHLATAAVDVSIAPIMQPVYSPFPTPQEGSDVTVQMHDVSLIQYDKACSYWLKGQCIFGNSCRYKHGLDERNIASGGDNNQKYKKYYTRRADTVRHSDIVPQMHTTSTVRTTSNVSNASNSSGSTNTSSTTCMISDTVTSHAVLNDYRFQQSLVELLDVANTAYPQWLVQLRFDPKFLVKNVTMSFGTTPPLSAQAKPTAISADEKAATTVKTIPIVVDTSSELTVDASPGSTSTSKRLLHAKISATRHTDRTCSNECKSSQDQSSVDSANVNSSSSSKSTNSSAGCLAAHEQRMEEQSMAVVADLAEQLQQLDVSNHSAHEKTLNADIDNTISTSALPAATLVPIVATNVAAATVKELQPDMVENIMQYRSRSPILTAHHMLEALGIVRDGLTSLVLLNAQLAETYARIKQQLLQDCYRQQHLMQQQLMQQQQMFVPAATAPAMYPVPRTTSTASPIGPDNSMQQVHSLQPVFESMPYFTAEPATPVAVSPHPVPFMVAPTYEPPSMPAGPRQHGVYPPRPAMLPLPQFPARPLPTEQIAAMQAMPTIAEYQPGCHPCYKSITPNISPMYSQDSLMSQTATAVEYTASASHSDAGFCGGGAMDAHKPMDASQPTQTLVRGERDAPEIVMTSSKLPLAPGISDELVGPADNQHSHDHIISSRSRSNSLYSNLSTELEGANSSATKPSVAQTLPVDTSVTSINAKSSGDATTNTSASQSTAVQKKRNYSARYHTGSTVSQRK